MKTIRQSVFETNSSSTHCVTIMTEEAFDRFKNDDGHWGSGSGASSGSGRMDRSGFGTGYCLCEDNGTGFGRGVGDGYYVIQ